MIRNMGFVLNWTINDIFTHRYRIDSLVGFASILRISKPLWYICKFTNKRDQLDIIHDLRKGYFFFKSLGKIYRASNKKLADVKYVTKTYAK